jgi:transketolase
MSKTIRDGFGEMMVELGQSNPNLIVLSADVSESLRLGEFKRTFPEQYVELGISEQNMAGVAAGIAMTGKTVVMASFAAFNPGRNWEQIRVSICEQNLDVKVVGGHAGLATGADGATHQALEDIALMSVLPKMRVVAPSSFVEAKAATAALVASPGPAYLRLSREGREKIGESKKSFKLGRGQVLRRGGRAMIIAYGLTVELALEAATQLYQDEALSVTVVNMATIKPLDKQLVINLARQNSGVVVVEEHQEIGGLGSMVGMVLAKAGLKVALEIVAIKDSFGESGTKAELFLKYGLNVSRIKECVWRAIEKAPTASDD